VANPRASRGIFWHKDDTRLLEGTADALERAYGGAHAIFVAANGVGGDAGRLSQVPHPPAQRRSCHAHLNGRDHATIPSLTVNLNTCTLSQACREPVQR
jgi:hypothetical protein